MRQGITLLFLLVAGTCAATQLSPSNERAFESYVANVEARLASQHARPETYLAGFPADADERNAWERRLVSGEIQVAAINGGTWQVNGALMHHWRGAAFVRNATPKDMIALLRDFNHSSGHYAPEVVSTRVLTDNGQTATIAVRLKEQRILTIVLDAEFAVETRLFGNDRGYSSSRSTHVWQVDNPGTPEERRRPRGEDDGFLWHLNSYWSFTRASLNDASREGLLIECEAVSLTRDVPVGLGWLITPIITDFPRETLGFTLRSTRKALIENVAKENKR